jgi:hypothetical protein
MQSNASASCYGRERASWDEEDLGEGRDVTPGVADMSRRRLLVRICADAARRRSGRRH